MRVSPMLPPDSLPERSASDAQLVRMAAPRPRRWWARWRPVMPVAAPASGSSTNARPVSGPPEDDEFEAQWAAHRSYLQRLREAGL